MKKIGLFCLSLIMLLAAFSCDGKQEPQIKLVTPEEAWEVFDRYPTNLSDLDLQRFKLREATLDKPLRVFISKGGLWKKETLPIGTKVLVEGMTGSGIPVYKLEDRNKLYVPITLK